MSDIYILQDRSQNYTVDDRMENRIKERQIGYNLRQRRGCTRAVPACPLPHSTPTQGGCEIFIFVISRNYKNENFEATLLLHNLPSATHSPLPSARRFFNAAQQCYFEMKTNTEPYFSVLSSIILCTELKSSARFTKRAPPNR